MSYTEIAVQRSQLISRADLRIAGVFLLVLSVASTAFAQKVTTEFDESVDFAKFKTFAIRQGKLNSRSPALNSELTKKRVESEIEQALIAKGLSAVTGQADLNVSFEFGSARTMDTRTYPVGRRGLGTRVEHVPESEGTLVIDLHDASTSALVWRGIASESEPNPMKLAEKLDDMVKKTIAKYPPKKKGQ